MPRRGLFTTGTPVRHANLREVTGVVQGHYFEGSVAWYVVEWLVEGFAPCIERTKIREIASPLHLLAAC